MSMQPQFDVIVIGAGIHGAGVAQAAASLGYKVLVLEQTSIAAATSSRSSKLIHGGLRYLETGQFSLVRECLNERRILLQIAPHLVHLLPFYIPIYQSSRRPAWQIAIGLRLYHALSGFADNSRYFRLSQSARAALPGLKQQGLRAVFQYFDAQTDDRLLTQAVMASAQGFTAQLAIGASARRIEKTPQYWQVHYRHLQGQQEPLQDTLATTRCVVNAAGPWVNQVHRKINLTLPEYEVELVQGSHIVVQREAPKAAFYVESPRDRRAVFVLPWHGETMIGTTETAFSGDPGLVSPQQSEIDYLIECYNAYFPQLAVTDADISQSFAGLRVLPGGNASHNKRKRETVLWEDPQAPAYLAIYGGKLTAYRHTAARVMARLRPFLPPTTAQLQTHQIKL